MQQKVKDILTDLKKMVILTGQISDPQIKTLQACPFIFFDNLDNVSISYNIVTDTSGDMPGLGSKVNFTLNFKDKYEPDQHHDKRIQALMNTVYTMLWPEVEIFIVDQDGKNLKNV